MRKLSKSQLTQHAALVDKLRETETALNDAIAGFNAGVSELFVIVQDAQDAVNSAREGASSFRDDVVADMESYTGERSDKWLESDAASSYADWQGEWEGLNLDEVAIEEPQEIEEPETVADELDALPVETS